MKIILSKDVEKLGKASDTVKVKDGFARNFLIPRGLALVANAGNLKKIEQDKLRKAREITRQIEEFKSLSEKLKVLSLTITVEANEKEELYGSITAQDISSALKEEGYSISKENIKLDEPIKELGIYEVSIKLHQQVEAKVKVLVVKQ